MVVSAGSDRCDESREVCNDERDDGMRVIAGSRRSIPLKTVEGRDVRPTTDRIKETLFNMISSSIPGTRVLDLFSGSGQIGIEALSRGSEYAVFVDNSRKAVSVIKENLKKTRFEEQARVICRTITVDGSWLQDSGAFDIIFIDPPYGMPDQDQLLRQIARQQLLAKHGLLIIEADRDTNFEAERVKPLKCVREKVYKTNKHVFFSYGGWE